jgi:hypothetical protein
MLPCRQSFRKGNFFSDFGDEKGNQIPVSGGLEGDPNFENWVKKVFFGRVGACRATVVRDQGSGIRDQ